MSDPGERPMARPARISSKHLAGSLKQHPLLQNVLAQGERILHVSRLYESVVPAALFRISRVANFKSGIIVIHADHGAAATKLKQLSRHLTDEFVKRGVECTGIEIRVQDAPNQYNELPAKQRPLSEQALAFMQDAAQKLDSDSPLRRQIETLIERAPRAKGPVKGE
jgi:hypothetical protein